MDNVLIFAKPVTPTLTAPVNAVFVRCGQAGRPLLRWMLFALFVVGVPPCCVTAVQYLKIRGYLKGVIATEQPEAFAPGYLDLVKR